MEIKIGYALAKPVMTQDECDTYTAMVQAVTAHNAACVVDDALWTIKDGADWYTVVEDGTVREPTAEELAAQEEARKKAEAWEKLPETVEALQKENETLKKESEMLKQCLLEMSEIVYA